MIMARSYAVRSVLMSTIAVIMCSGMTFAGSTTRYVDDDAAPGGDGLSWATAYTALEAALAELPAAVPAITEVRIAQGVYHPDGGTGDRTLSYLVDGPPGVHIRGGYAGLGAPDPDAHDPATFVTLLSADLNGDDEPDGLNKTDNSHQIMRTLTPCTIFGLRFEGAYSLDDAGISVNGGAVSVGGTSLRVDRCVFRDNAASRGGAIALFEQYSVITIANSRFDQNHAATLAGAILTYGVFEQPQIPMTRMGNCVFTRNSSGSTGGAIYTYRGIHSVSGSLFAGNTCNGGTGGAIYVSSNSSPCTYYNTAFLGNTCPWGVGGGLTETTIGEMNNCIFMDNRDASGVSIASQIYSETLNSARNNCVPGWTDRPFTVPTNIGNLDAFPRFVDARGPDGLYGTDDDDIRLVAGSPCVDAGTDRFLFDRADIDNDGSVSDPPEFDLLWRPRFVEDALAPNTGAGTFWNLGPIDIGPLEYQEDCDGNRVTDSAQILLNPGLDADMSGILDTCEPFLDCNGNGVRDGIDIVTGHAQDCNGNGTPDSCDIISGASQDLDLDGIPDDCQSIVIYVDDDAPSGGDGRSWETAKHDLHEALEIARGQLAPSSVHIAGGRYPPAPPGGDRTIAFRVPEGVTVRGSFAAAGQSPDVQNLLTTPTIIDGDLNGDDSMALREDNTRQLVICEGFLIDASLSGLVIRNGHYPESLQLYSVGAGVWVPRSGLRLTGSILSKNHADYGGAVSTKRLFLAYNYPRVETVIEDCLFSENTAAQSGGAIEVTRTDLTLRRCHFESNAARSGGAVRIDHSTMHGGQSSFILNTSETHGSAIYSQSSPVTLSVTLSGCVLAANRTFEHIGDNFGAAVDLSETGTNRLTLFNCTSSGNTPSSYRAEYLVIYNSIAWGDTSGAIGGTQDLLLSSNNLLDTVNPLFIDPIGPDGIPRTGDEDLRLSSGSPAIDAGSGLLADPGLLFDIDGNPRFLDDCATPDTGVLGPYPAVIDIGAYEYQPPTITGDTNGDHTVDVDDLNAILGAWNTSVGIGDPRDLANNDGVVNVDDLNVLLANWNTVCN